MIRGDELPVDQLPVGVGDRRPHDQRVGLLVDLRIGQVPHAALRVFLPVGQAHADVNLGEAAALLLPRLADDLEIAHADRKQHVHRVLADDRRQDAARRIDQIAERIGRAADAAVDRRHGCRCSRD